MKRQRWACFDALLVLILVALTGCGTDERTLSFSSADFLLSESASPPADSSAWKPVVLPDLWARTRPGVNGSGWYRMQWYLDKTSSGAQALYLPHFGQSDQVFINGTQVTNPGSIGPKRRMEPQYLGLNPVLLRQGTNTLHLNVRRGWLLEPPMVGDAEALQLQFTKEHWLSVKGPHQLFGLTLGLGIFMLTLSSQRRNEQGYRYFGLASLAYSLWLLWVRDTTPLMALVPPVSFVVGYLSAQSITVCTFLFALRYGGWRRPILETILWLTIPLAGVVALVQEVQDWPFDVFYWLIDGTMLASNLFLFGLIAWRRRTVESFALLLASSGFAAYFLLNFDGLDLSPVEVPTWVEAYAYLPLFLVMGWLLVIRFARSLNESEQLAADLEHRVATKQGELQRNYEQMERFTREAAIVEERQRIMSDMHDGIGGQLISTLSLVEHGEVSKKEVAGALRECIDDLRLAIDSLEPTEEDLLPVLGNLRYRLEGRLKQQGIALEWQVREVPKLACLTPQNVLHILRILQEAFTNILKHAHAKQIRVETSVEHGRVSIDISDNGSGFEHQLPAGSGRGLENMKVRARTIGGELKITPSSSGTTLSLLLPVG